jgi:hypothetical protein
VTLRLLNPTDVTAFFNLGENEPRITDSRLLVAVGVPTQLSTMDYEKSHIHATTVTIPCAYTGKLIGPARMHRLTIIRSEAKIPTAFDLDGMSGGGVFSIDSRLGGYKTFFRGLILRGGNDQLYFIETSFFRQMIEKMAD